MNRGDAAAATCGSSRDVAYRREAGTRRFGRETGARLRYPEEQVHSESFANAYVSLAAKAAGFSDASSKLDWHFGPFALRAKHAPLWLSHRGELWDAQVVPIVSAMRAGLAVGGVEVPFVAPLSMKAEEEDNLVFVQKRLDQINFLDPKVISALKGEGA